MKINYRLKCSILLGAILLNSSAHALTKQKQGLVSYFVSPSNHLIHLDLPYKVGFNLIENPNLPAATRYTLSVYGDWDGNLERNDVRLIQEKYPNYKISNQSHSSAVKGCQIQLSTGRALECSIPTGIGSYFSVFEVLSQVEGDQLKAEIARKQYPLMKVDVLYPEPFVTKTEELNVPLLDFYQSISQESSLNLERVVQWMVKQAKNSNVDAGSKLYDSWVSNLFRQCVQSAPEQKGPISNLDDVLSIRLIAKKPSQNSMSLIDETLDWKSVHHDAALDITEEQP